MVQYQELPDGWRETEYSMGPSRASGPYKEELEAMWVPEDVQIRVSCRHSVDADGKVTYPIMVEQHVEYDGLSAVFQTHSRVADNRKEAEEMAVEFMKEVNDGKHTLRVLGVQVPDDMDFVQFFTISDSELPGELTGDQLIEVIDSDEYGNDIDDLPDEISRELAGDEMIQVDVFPRHKSEVEGLNES